MDELFKGVGDTIAKGTADTVNAFKGMGDSAKNLAEASLKATADATDDDIHIYSNSDEYNFT